MYITFKTVLFISYFEKEIKGTVPNFFYTNIPAAIGTTATTITPTTTNAILAMDASVSPNCEPTDTPRAFQLVPRANPRAIGLLILKTSKSFFPNA